MFLKHLKHNNKSF